MRISATDIHQWSDRREAQEILPLLVRRLIAATAEPTNLVMPGGDSVNVPGWDGEVDAPAQHRSVPAGRSYWELGTSNNPKAKAQEDFEKRREQISAEEAEHATFVFVTSRRWAGKDAWRKSVESEKFWADVKVLDADDLEAWLESAPGVALWFGQKIGRVGHGVQSFEQYWEHWRNQSEPALTTSAFSQGRASSRLALQELLDKKESHITIIADSQSEAVAFACAQLIETGHSLHGACVTSKEGWQYVDSNLALKIVLIADNTLAENWAPPKDTSLIVPMAIGDPALQNHLGQRVSSNMIELPRPRPEDFEESLRELGVASSDAYRYHHSMGRSWTVFRRQHTKNLKLKSPPWLSGTNQMSLMLLTLLGAWNGASESDKTIVSQIANKPYEDIESELFSLIALDDAPLLRIASTWKAKAPLELFYFMVPRVSDQIRSRFFKEAKDIFETPDPILELEDNERYMAQIYGKIRKESGALVSSMAESMARLSSFADDHPHPPIKRQVRDFVEHLFSNADGERWLSLSSYLRSFAEAAPEEFLAAIEASLKKPDQPIARLLTETKKADIMGRCWHANLLWALESLAWHPARLERVVRILIELCSVPLAPNIGNSPFNTLGSLFRYWRPQTSAPVQIRIQTIQRTAHVNSDLTWKLILSLMPDRSPHFPLYKQSA